MTTLEKQNKTILHDVLCKKNAHVRDKNINFFENDHKYIITSDPNSTYTSVTTWNHSHFPEFNADIVINNMMNGRNWKEGHKYWGLTSEQIKEKWNTNKDSVANAGTDLHYEIECFMNNKKLKKYEYKHEDLIKHYDTTCDKLNPIQETLEWQYFINFIKDTPNLKPYRTEWTVYNEDVKIAGSIDMVYENPDGTLSIYDWKRAKNITRINTFNKFAFSILSIF